MMKWINEDRSKAAVEKKEEVGGSARASLCRLHLIATNIFSINTPHSTLHSSSLRDLPHIFDHTGIRSSSSHALPTSYQSFPAESDTRLSRPPMVDITSFAMFYSELDAKPDLSPHALAVLVEEEWQRQERHGNESEQ